MKELDKAMLEGGLLPTQQSFMGVVAKAGMEEAQRREAELFFLRNHTRPDRKTTKTPQQQREDYYAAEAKRIRRQRRNLKNAGLEVPSEITEGDML